VAAAVARAGPGRPATSDRGDPAAAGSGSPDLSRRRLLRQGAAITAGLAAVSVSGYGVSRAYRPPKVTRLAVPLARLDPRADGLRVAVISDIHVSPVFGAGQVDRVVDLVNTLDADLITVVGDMVSSEVGQVRDAAAPLRRMRSRYGAFFVTGNHEYYNGYEEWIEAADELGLRVLRNERLEVAHRGGAIDLAGVNDRQGSEYGDAPDYGAALGDRDPSRPVVLMAHQPVQVHEAAQYGVDLQLSGHTHGGQLYPFDYLVRLEQPVVSGLSEVDGTLVYVTNGAGFWGPPMRVGADPDVTLLELRAP
jgi:predicted MPP superfamily phosphohydrolase